MGGYDMAIRFRKSIKLMPGVRLNLSKTGISTTVGVKGASVNLGKKGAYMNTGSPGTGLYSRTKIANADEPRQSSKNAGPLFIAVAVVIVLMLFLFVKP